MCEQGQMPTQCYLPCILTHNLSSGPTESQGSVYLHLPRAGILRIDLVLNPPSWVPGVEFRSPCTCLPNPFYFFKAAGGQSLTPCCFKSAVGPSEQRSQYSHPSASPLSTEGPQLVWAGGCLWTHQRVRSEGQGFTMVSTGDN